MTVSRSGQEGTVLALWDTTGTEVVHKLAAERRSAGGVASGLALTLVAVADEPSVRAVEDAVTIAAAEHPCRLLIVTRALVNTPGVPDRLDAEIIVGGRLGPCEAVVMRMQGRLALHAESVVMPLLAPDVPVVTWWHGTPPDRIAYDPLGVVAERRVTDISQCADPIAALRDRAEDFAPGDTDLAWTRVTPWRSMLAAALDQKHSKITAAVVEGEAYNPSTELLGLWLADRLEVPVERLVSDGPGLTAVTLSTADGDISLDRADGSLAELAMPGQPDRRVALKRRDTADLIAEELRRLDPDDIYKSSVKYGVKRLVHTGAARASAPAQTPAPAAAGGAGNGTAAPKPAPPTPGPGPGPAPKKAASEEAK
jgi:glucose-6-phosphate dehydrogenase assembly protein OpcA